MNFICQVCSVEFLTARGLANHRWKMHERDAVCASLPSKPWELTADDRGLLVALCITPE